ncbi:rRNA (cytidine-2'-O-)-methyltransferase [Porphyromonas sp. HMSC077F02]|uniref:16S rRNA (cytidine(1402)-2'-O)-methyltransferase n=1 Tax=Porphyromonas sp. HMSC077F02 TaxID=1739529 RepID=UPI0008A4FCFF|nr:16S rRNA (cytidine(1402)-2'-O)-methyltransferase [Porphyromonas sp. HMSC077F02]OFO57475.1 rRNA (cytidine-2'-O-)-methyltransferase [Porphyromonas sp. HMSC077F02]
MVYPLVVIPTPVGNMEDITLRALRLLREADMVYAEDTRTTAKLFQAHDIQAPLKSFHIHNEHSVAGELASRVERGERVALVSDAGTPGISDPGFMAVRACLERGLEVTCLPGPTAFVPALVGSGLPCERFFFEGFLPNKKGRKTRIEALVERDVTTVLYESPKRLVKLLGELQEIVGGDRQVVVARELSKKFEEFHRGSVSELQSYFEENEPLGEIVVMVAPQEKQESVHVNKYKEHNFR